MGGNGRAERQKVSNREEPKLSEFLQTKRWKIGKLGFLENEFLRTKHDLNIIRNQEIECSEQYINCHTCSVTL